MFVSLGLRGCHERAQQQQQSDDFHKETRPTKAATSRLLSPHNSYFFVFTDTLLRTVGLDGCRLGHGVALLSGGRPDPNGGVIVAISGAWCLVLRFQSKKYRVGASAAEQMRIFSHSPNSFNDCNMRQKTDQKKIITSFWSAFLGRLFRQVYVETYENEEKKSKTDHQAENK